MPGPNSAPNGDAGLIRGHIRERFVYCLSCYVAYRSKLTEEERENLPATIPFPLREHLAAHNKLITGKTALDRG